MNLLILYILDQKFLMFVLSKFNDIDEYSWIDIDEPYKSKINENREILNE